MGIPLLREFPPIVRARIEGRNGIGKTLSIRLLQLATGDQPYLGEPALWRSLRNALGAFEIDATEMQGAESIVWRFDPRHWPEEPEVPSAEWQGFEVSINGKSADVNAARELLAVLRLDGSETVRDTIVARMRDAAGQLRIKATRLRPISDAYATPLDTIRDLTAGIDVDAIERLESSIRAVEDQVAEAQKTLNVRQQRLGSAREAISILEVLRSGTLASALSERESIDAELKSLQGKVAGLQAEATKLASHSSLHLRDAVRRHEQTVKRTTTRLENLRTEIERLAEGLGIDPDQRDAISNRTKLLKRRDSLAQTQRSLGVLPLSLGVGRDIEQVIGNRRGLPNDAPLALTPVGEITVGTLRTGIASFRDRASKSVPIDIAELEREIKQIGQHVIDTGSLLTKLRDVRAVQANLADAERRFEQAVETLEATAEREAFEKNVASQRELSDKIGTLNERRGYVSALIARLHRHGSESEMKFRLSKLLRAIGSTEDEVQSVIADLENSVQAESNRIVALEDQRKRIHDDLGSAHARMQSALQSLNAAKFDAWRGALSPLLPGREDDFLTNVKKIANLHTIISRVDHAIDVIRGYIDGAPAAVDQLASRIDTRTAASEPARPIGKAAKEYFERILAHELGQDRIAEVLFESSGSLGFDLEQMEVSWYGSDGAYRVRPLEAFSSGERAWTYTLARLHTPVRAAANRILVLDEFGAYIEAERLAALERTLKDRIPGATADQLILILPLTAGWDRGLDADELLTRKEWVHQYGYFAVDMDN